MLTTLRRQFHLIIFSLFYFINYYIIPVNGRVAGKVGYSNSRLSGVCFLFIFMCVKGRSYSGINDELIAVCIGMATTIFILISLALCYIAHEKWTQKRGYYVTV